MAAKERKERQRGETTEGTKRIGCRFLGVQRVKVPMAAHVLNR
jgi:hypothetical protein